MKLSGQCLTVEPVRARSIIFVFVVVVLEVAELLKHGLLFYYSSTASILLIHDKNQTILPVPLHLLFLEIRALGWVGE